MSGEEPNDKLPTYAETKAMWEADFCRLNGEKSAAEGGSAAATKSPTSTADTAASAMDPRPERVVTRGRYCTHEPDALARDRSRSPCVDLTRARRAIRLSPFDRSAVADRRIPVCGLAGCANPHRRSTLRSRPSTPVGPR